MHSTWALVTGSAVLVLAHERYGFVPWVIAFLGLTWLTTLFFSRPNDPQDSPSRGARVRRGLASYATRVLYQETLFFLIPFYAYSTVVPSWNMLFLALLGAMAVLSCLDLVFDRWLQSSPVFGLIFFASVAFAALNLLLPLLLAMPPARAAQVAGVAAVASSIPLVFRSRTSTRTGTARVAAAALAILAVSLWLQPLVPPVPLRLQQARFGADFDAKDMALIQPLGARAELRGLAGQLVVLARVFAPSRVPSHVVLEWTMDGEPVRTSREVEITAHEGGFRVWDTYRPDEGPLRPGLYRVVLRTAEGGMFGSASLRLE